MINKKNEDDPENWKFKPTLANKYEIDTSQGQGGDYTLEWSVPAKKYLDEDKKG